MGNTDKVQKSYTEAETEARREAALQVMFATPHKPHEKASKGKRRESSQRK
jgi:hypothetical protein